MEIKPVVVEVTESELRNERLSTARVAEILEYQNHDSVRQAALRGAFERVGRGFYKLDSVLSYRQRQQQARPVSRGATTAAGRQSRKAKTQ
ncbi:hypothetical protein [Longimicrobium sp.]|uniref:hypothetical protein n=1 Tax=Longimicrobium sp. TaxID=2029185 RepID=UPI002E365A4F|nr:hypothetical protein [Longimicrobium sp.]HEX6040290.1 hypothetical protein [Longimicrobium sp.]